MFLPQMFCHQLVGFLHFEQAGLDRVVISRVLWVLEKSKPLGQILMEQKVLRADLHAANNWLPASITRISVASYTAI